MSSGERPKISIGPVRPGETGSGRLEDRRLAAVAFVDIVGYTILMANDETRTHRRWMRILSEVISPQAERFHGTVVKSTGDGVLVEFPSAHDAVEWARQVQRQVIPKQVEHDNESATITLRVAVHLGDVMTTGFDVFGDGVNVAARLQQHGIPGGVILSEAVYDLVRGTIGPGARDLGFLQLKNLEKPIRAYSLDPEANERDSSRHHASVDLRAASPPAGSEFGSQSQSPPLGRPSVAVLPFANLSGDLQQDYFSDGITEDIITELSRFSELLVIARNSSFQYKGKAVDIRQIGRELGARYVVEGSVRRSGDRIRITAQLIDTMTGTHRWAERYDRELHDAFVVQDEMARTIVALLAAHMKHAEIERALLTPPAAWQAYEYYLRGAEAFFLHYSRRAKGSLYEARRLLEQCLAIDPGYARAAAMLSWIHVRAYTNPLDSDYLSHAALDRALEMAQMAVHLDVRLPQAHAQLGYVLLYKRRHDDTVAGFERAFALNPNFIDYRFAVALMFAGEPARAIEVLEASIRLDPFQPSHALGHTSVANYMLKRYGEAVRLMRECAARLPHLQWPHLSLAAAYAQAGQLEEARAEAAEVLRINPAFTIESWKPILVYKNPKDLEHRIDGARKAGLPET